MWKPLVPAGVLILVLVVGFVVAGVLVNKLVEPPKHPAITYKQRLEHNIAQAERSLCRRHRPGCGLGLMKSMEIQSRKGRPPPTVKGLETSTERALRSLTTGVPVVVSGKAVDEAEAKLRARKRH